MIVDGLDECNGDNDQRHIVKLLGKLANKDHGILRCLIVSRPEPQILSAITSLATQNTVARVSLNEEAWGAHNDIKTYLQSGFDMISSRMDIPQPWPSNDVIDLLTQKAGGIFVYASTVLKYIDDEDNSPMVLLEHVLKLSPGTRPFAELDQLYQRILTACPLRYHPTLLHIFGFILLRNPTLEKVYDVSLIEALLDLSPGDVAIVLRRLHSILTFRTIGSNRTVRFLHASFGDFIFNEERSGQFFIDRQKENLFLATKCIEHVSDDYEMRGHRRYATCFLLEDWMIICIATVHRWVALSTRMHGILGTIMGSKSTIQILLA